MKGERLDAFNNFNRPFQARGDFMWNGIAVVVSPNIPMEHVGDEIKPIMPHRFVQWCERLLGKPSYPVCYVRGPKVEEEQVFMMQGKMFMSPATWQSLKYQIERAP